MKRLGSRNDQSPRKQIVLHRETLRRLDSKDLEQAAGGATAWYTCTPTKHDDDGPL